MVEYISFRARTRRSRALHGSIFASRVSRNSLEGRVNSSLARIMRLATSTSTPRARARSNARAERLARRSCPRAGSRVVSRANADDASPSGLDDDAHVVLFGYGAQEVPRVRELVDALRAAVVDSGVDVGPVRVVSVSPEARGKKLDDVLAGALSGAADADGGDGERAVMLHGYSAKVLMPDLKMEMNEEGFEGAVFGVFTDKSRALALGDAAKSVVDAHERYWNLRPTTEADSYDVAKDADFEYLGETDAWDVERVTTAMAVSMDRADVLDTASVSRGEERLRSDTSHVVAVDGVVGEPLRQALIDALTEIGYDHYSEPGPPEHKWNRETRDGLEMDDGESPPPSWGLTPETLDQVMKSNAVRSFRARLAALYPEYDIRTMPSDALEPDGIPGSWGGSSICAAIGNAAVYGDMFNWHIDMDPSQLDPSAPWVERFGSYVNRERGRPLFVSAMVYLNPGPWHAAFDAETLFLDPGTGTGVFVRPQPGRVVLMDQDILHRVSTPSQIAGVPRYSFVLKLCFFPKHKEQKMTLIRDAWGEPCHFGTAAGHVGGEAIVEEEFECDPALEDCDLVALGINAEDYFYSQDEDYMDDDEEDGEM